MVLRQASGPTPLCLASGLGIALVGGRVMEGFLYEVTSRDPVVFAGVAGILLCVALLAAAVPARGATRISPTEAIRAE